MNGRHVVQMGMGLLFLFAIVGALAGCASALQDLLVKDKETGTWHVDGDVGFAGVLYTDAELKLKRYGIIGGAGSDVSADISGTIEFTAVAKDAPDDPEQAVMYKGVYNRDGAKIIALGMLEDGERTDTTLSLELVIKSDTRMEGLYEHTGDEVTTGTIIARR